jgi:hypothetical protein
MARSSPSVGASSQTAVAAFSIVAQNRVIGAHGRRYKLVDA